MSPHTSPADPLDTLLQGLREAQPSSGFETRLLAHLETAATPPAPSSSPVDHLLPHRPALRRPAVLLPFAAAIAAALLLALLLPRAHAPQRTSTASARPAAPAPAPALAQAPTPAPPSRHLTPQRRPTLAEVETAAPTLPPPPLPITAEERNIQRFRSLHSAVSLAALSPAAIDAHNAADQQALHDFFDPTHQEN